MNLGNLTPCSVGSHADDIEIGCAGTLLRLLERNPGLKVHWIVLSAPADRKSEARQSAQTILADAHEIDVRVADFEETFFPYVGMQIKSYMAALATELAPDLIFTHWRRDFHQDPPNRKRVDLELFSRSLDSGSTRFQMDGDMGQPNTFIRWNSHSATGRWIT